MAGLPLHRPGLVECRMMVLMALDRLGTSGNLTLISFFFETELINYFDLQTALHDLKESGEVVSHQLPADELFDISPKGKETLAMFEGRIALSMRTALMEAVPGFLARVRTQTDLPARIDRDSGRAYRVSMQVVEQGAPLLTLEVSLPTYDLARRFQDAWPHSARALYDHIIHELSKEEPA